MAPLRLDDSVVKAAFMQRYLDDHGSLNNCQGEWEWWVNPLLRCAAQTNKSPGEKRCKKPCKSCVNWSKRAIIWA